MRWPRPTVNSALMARMPTSSGWSMAARIIGLNGRLCSERVVSMVSVPLLSRGRPTPSTTRPSNWSPTGTCLARSIARRRRNCSVSMRSGAEGRSTASTRAPGARPKTSSDGIRYSFSPAKPTTSASTGMPLAGMMRQVLPRGSFSPLASITRPLMRVSRPLGHNGCAWLTAIWQLARKRCQRPICSGEVKCSTAIPWF